MREREDRYEAIGKGPRGLGGGEGGVLLLTQLRCGTAHCTFLSTNRFGSAVPWSCAENKHGESNSGIHQCIRAILANL